MGTAGSYPGGKAAG